MNFGDFVVIAIGVAVVIGIIHMYVTPDFKDDGSDQE